jgi:cytochrome c biogenesis protein CcmG/thiol:disulfide interchange protein DsbE
MIEAEREEGDVAPRTRRLAIGVAIPMAVVLALFIGLLATRKPATDRQIATPLLDKLAPVITGTTISGAAFDLDHLRGQWVVVNFFATWCVPCRQEHPELLSFSRRHAQAGDAEVVSVVFGDDADTVRTFFADNGGDWPVVLGDEGRVALDYGVAAVPESYLVDPEGFVRAKIVGGVTSDGLDRILAEVEGRLSGSGQ